MSEPAGRILAAAENADHAGVAAAAGELTDKGRRAVARDAAEAVERYRWDDPQRSSYSLALLASATVKKLMADGWNLESRAWPVDPVLTVFRARGPEFTETFVRAALSGENAQFWTVLRTLVREGVVAFPSEPLYITGMVWHLRGPGSWWDIDSAYQALVADPGLLENEVWMIFEVDAGTELTNARGKTDTGRSTPTDKNRWTYALVRLANEGRLERARLLDASLEAQLRDFRPSMVSWYSHFHEALAPTHDERIARIPTYLAMCVSSTQAVTKAGLDAIKLVADDVPSEELARAAAGPLSQRQKNSAVAMLGLLDRALARDEPAARSALLLAIADGLAHERLDVQTRALELLERRYDGGDAAVGARILGLSDGVAPSLRDRLGKLTGIAAPRVEVGEEGAGPATVEELDRALAEIDPAARVAAGADAAVEAVRAGHWPDPAVPTMTPRLVRLLRPELVPVATVDELIELAAAVLEAQGDGDEMERFLDGVSRLCGERPAGFERRTGGLVKRAEQIERSDTTLGFSGAKLAAALVRTWAGEGATGSRPYPHGLAGFLGIRTHELRKGVARREARPLLAFPTHAGGWIDPAVLAERESGSGRIRNKPAATDLAQARARAFPSIEPMRFEPSLGEETGFWGPGRFVYFTAGRMPSSLGAVAKTLEGFTRGRSEPKEPSPLERLAQTLHFAVPDDTAAYADSAWSGDDWLAARWSQTIIPSLPEAPFAATLVNAAAHVDNPIAWGRPEATIERVLDPDERIPPIGWWAIGASLLSKSPDLQRAAADALVASVDDGRFDPRELAKGLAWLLSSGFGNAGRLSLPLGDLGRISSLHAAQVVRLVSELAAAVETAPHGFQAPLEIAVECAVSSGLGVADPVQRAALERIGAAVSRSSKLGRAARDLLGREEDRQTVASLRLAAAGKSIERARRYAGG